MICLVRVAGAALAVQCAVVPVLAAQQVSAFEHASVASFRVHDRVAEPGPAPAPVITSLRTSQTPRPGPMVDAARAGVSAPARAVDAKAAAAASSGSLGKGQNVALMTVGGIALLTGLIIGGDGGTLIAVSGAVVGLYGLYNYIK